MILNIFVLSTVFIFPAFLLYVQLLLMKATKEDAVYENFQEQNFEAEDQQLLYNQVKCP
jgi:hypothetical protein